MSNLKFLNKKEQKDIISCLKKQWGFEDELDYVFVLNEDEKIYIVNNEAKHVDLSKLRVNALGSYFGRIDRDGFRLSIEGAQMIGPFAKKGILELGKDEVKDWMKGIDIDRDMPEKGFLIMKHGDDYLGCGKAIEGRIMNFVPKIRRLDVMQ